MMSTNLNPELWPFITDLTRIVKAFPLPVQLQKVRVSEPQSKGARLLGFEFYPAPRALVFAQKDSILQVFTGPKLQLGNPSQHPVQLYIKAHFEGAFIHELSAENSKIIFYFGSRGQKVEGLSLELEFQGARLKLRACVPERRVYSAEINLGSFFEPQVLVAKKQLGKTEAKQQKLKRNIEGDIAEAKMWLDRFEELCNSIEENPSLNFDTALSEGLTRDALFKKRRRMKLKLFKAGQRLKEILEGPTLSITETPKLPINKMSERGGRKKPGLWVELKEDLWARVGRNAAENDELFRQAASKDLWFHVRSVQGAHVWIPRGQKGFGAKDEIQQNIIALGARLALLNSKLSKSGSGDVDFTERRYLKKMAGQPGKLKILRSETRFVRLG